MDVFTFVHSIFKSKLPHILYSLQVSISAGVDGGLSGGSLQKIGDTMFPL